MRLQSKLISRIVILTIDGNQLILTIDRSSQILNNMQTKFKLVFVLIRTDVEH